MVWFFVRGSGERRTCETRLAEGGEGYELVTTDATGVHVEVFPDLYALLAREHELLGAWRAMGWRPETTGATRRR
jgi:hypothetical protein